MTLKTSGKIVCSLPKDNDNFKKFVAKKQYTVKIAFTLNGSY